MVCHGLLFNSTKLKKYQILLDVPFGCSICQNRKHYIYVGMKSHIGLSISAKKKIIIAKINRRDNQE
jgi:hypothetical protein